MFRIPMLSGPAAVAVLLAKVAAVALLVAGPADARRRSADRAQPPPNLEYEPEDARCAPAYANALRELFARPTPQPKATAMMVRTPMPGVGPRWVFHADGDRRRQRDDLGRLIDGDRVCAEELSRGGRTRCARWETLPPSAEPVVPVPPPTREETRIIAAIAEMVSHKGAPPEFLGNGRYTIMTERVATDLEAYALQEPHAALCTGADELVDFLVDKLAPLRKRIGDVESLRARALQPIAPRVSALAAALAPPPAAADTQPGAVDAGAADGGPISPSPAVLTAPGTPASQPALTVAPPEPPTPAGWLAKVAAMVLAPADAAAVSAKATPLAGLRHFAGLFAEGRSPAPAAARAQAKAALRAIEAAAYIDLLAKRYRDLDQALFGTLEDVRKARASSCTCGG